MPLRATATIEPRVGLRTAMYLAAICTPFPSHLGQMLCALGRMKQRGHRVELWGGDGARSIARDSGLGFRSVPVDPGIKSAAETAFTAADYYTKCIFPMVAQQLPPVLQYCREDPPDVLHSNARIPTAAVASLLTGIPAVNHSCSGVSFGLIPEDVYGFCPSETEPRRKREMMLALARNFHHRMDEEFHSLVGRPFGLPPLKNAVGFASDRCVLVLSIRELSNPRIARQKRVHFTGPLLDEAALPTAVRPPGRYGYLTLGTWPLPRERTLAMYRELIAGIPEQFAVVVGLGGRFRPKDLGSLPGRARAYSSALQAPLIRQAEFVVCHGGCQTINEALYFAKPILAVPPSLPEPREMVHKVCQAGACMRIDPADVTAQRVRDAVRELTSARHYKDNASALGRLFRGTGGRDQAAELLEAAFDPRRAQAANRS